MANLSITLACNRGCRYCFAADGGEPGRSAGPMPLAAFRALLGFVDRSRTPEARLLGGEPTLHPDFVAMAAQVLESGRGLVLFSNGLMPPAALEALAQAPEGQVAVLVNVADPGQRQAGETDHLEHTLRRLGHRATVGFNIDRPGIEPAFLLDLVRRFDLAPTLRLGLAHPSLARPNVWLHPRHYPEVGRRLARLAEQAAAVGVSLSFDCGFVPCMFPADPAELFGTAAEAIGRQCGPIPDILPDGRAIPCYPLASVAATAVGERDTDQSVARRLADRLRPFRAVGVYRACEDCGPRAAGRCLGGCLAHALRRLRGAPLATGSAAPEAVAAARVVAAASVAPPATERGPALAVPYIDQPLSFWRRLAEHYGRRLASVYLPLPEAGLASGRPPQPARHVAELLADPPLAISVLANPMVLTEPVEEVARRLIAALERWIGDPGVTEVTVTNLILARRLREALPGLSLCASTLAGIGHPQQLVGLEGVFETIVPATAVVRDQPALRGLRAAWPGRIRLLVNEACLPSCPFRVQHFYEMSASPAPASLCGELLARQPWLRLTGAWVLPQHLHLYDGLYDQLKLAGRVTLADPARYERVLAAYLARQPLTPDAIGGGPASVLAPWEIDEEFFRATLECGRCCQECPRCRDYYRQRTLSAAAGAPDDGQSRVRGEIPT